VPKVVGDGLKARTLLPDAAITPPLATPKYSKQSLLLLLNKCTYDIFLLTLSILFVK